jgi:hypothetical protein
MEYNYHNSDGRLNWISQNLKIIDKSGHLVPLVANDGQLMFYNSINVQREKKLPVRIVLLKPRQVGWTTWSEAEGFTDVYHIPNWNAMAVSLDSDSTDEVFGMTKRFHDEMPSPRPTDISRRKEIVFSKPHRSRFLSQTAGKVGVGRSFRSQFLHCSEVAFWQNAKEQLAGLYQIVPDKEGTVIVLESTANGVGGAFYDTFWEAVERRKKNPEDWRGFVHVFFPWYRFPEYSTPLPTGFTMDSEEKQIQEDYKLTKEQIYWRRLKIDQMNGDVNLFKQEYPATALEAFQASGNPVFTQQMIRFQAARVAPTPRCCVFTKSGVQNVKRKIDCWQVAYLPKENHQYALGIDTMEGRLSDMKDPKSNPDYDGMAIMDRTDGVIAAIWHGRGNQADLADQALLGANLYNEAWVAPEIPHSMVVLNKFKEAGYQNIYNRQIHDERITVSDSENLGWRTTLITRGYMVNDFITAMRDAALTVMFSDLIDEMKTFIKDKQGKPIHMAGKHDDILFAAMIALQVHLRCPFEAQAYQHSHIVNIEPEKDKEETLVRVGAVDDGEDEEDDYHETHCY